MIAIIFINIFLKLSRVYLYHHTAKKVYFYSFLTIFTVLDISAKVYSAAYIFGGSIWDHFDGDQWMDDQGMRFNKDKKWLKFMYDSQVVIQSATIIIQCSVVNYIIMRFGES